MYKTEFVTAEEYAEYLKSPRPYQPRSVLDYLKIDVINERGMQVIGKLMYRHSSAYDLYIGAWTYLKESDTRSISPIADFLTKNKPFYVTHGTRFLRVQDIVSDKTGNLILYFEHHDLSSLN
ncbi:hypothetical protein CJD36_016720 [Flavipsychrobacter stenotrophus]|uniref:Uncharacterized protein n=1 Tax=Flavipsychrobacter stenotrophus TaxID=2077091 RepID=A0A2S7SRP7_9BACT|nr:hypothetical protein [Flavipsychrobacter stenotrophus]PQJ09582.1 hypothetical protein CJD36_016720 [Flavipsychrobacter stenotrophus]